MAHPAPEWDHSCCVKTKYLDIYNDTLMMLTDMMVMMIMMTLTDMMVMMIMMMLTE